MQIKLGTPWKSCSQFYSGAALPRVSGSLGAAIDQYAERRCIYWYCTHILTSTYNLKFQSYVTCKVIKCQSVQKTEWKQKRRQMNGQTDRRTRPTAVPDRL